MKGQGPTEYRRACKSTENASFERAFFPGERAFFPGEKAFIILSVFPFLARVVHVARSVDPMSQL